LFVFVIRDEAIQFSPLSDEFECGVMPGLVPGIHVFTT
jgi:hypothetical protein